MPRRVPSKYVSDPKTSSRMKQVRRLNTGPEETVQQFLRANGFKYRLHASELPGSPDLILPMLRKVIFVHGCYWHRHRCWRATTPVRNIQLWARKFENNVKRDRRNYRMLRAAGWKVLVVWECQIRRSSRWQARVLKFLREEADVQAG